MKTTTINSGGFHLITNLAVYFILKPALSYNFLRVELNAICTICTKSPKNDALFPANAKNAIGAGTFTFTPIIPASILSRNVCACLPFDV